ncbi:MAG TPA: hemolysin D [Firmicutes bacterium]|jgi:multidrug resistance efflux pump|nr:hemolysin D [Bacillota bacterium]
MEKRKSLILMVLAGMIAALGAIGFYYWYNNAFYVTTDDARITGDLVKICPQVTGKLLEFTVEEGDAVLQDQIIGRQETINLPDNAIDQSVIRAPINGIIIKKAANIGEIESMGQTLAVMVDPDQMYVSADIEETSLGRVKPGQTAEFTVDQFPGIKFTGKVRSVGEASNSTFSLLPTSTGSTFTKVVQRIPVKIRFARTNVKLLPGTNAIVRIHVR